MTKFIKIFKLDDENDEDATLQTMYFRRDYIDEITVLREIMVVRVLFNKIPMWQHSNQQEYYYKDSNLFDETIKSIEE